MAGVCGTERLRKPGTAAFVALMLAATPSAAAELPWTGLAYDYVAVDQDVRSALSEFGRNVGVPVVLSDAVRGRVRGKVHGENAGAFLNEIADANGLVWYFDGSILHVGSTSELATRIVNTGGVGAVAVQDEIRRLGLLDQRFALRVVAGGDALAVSGPPAFIAAAEQVAQSMAPRPVAMRDDPRVRIFRGGTAVEVVASGGNGDAPAPPSERR